MHKIYLCRYNAQYKNILHSSSDILQYLKKFLINDYNVNYEKGQLFLTAKEYFQSYKVLLRC